MSVMLWESTMVYRVVVYLFLNRPVSSDSNFSVYMYCTPAGGPLTTLVVPRYLKVLRSKHSPLCPWYTPRFYASLGL